MSWFYSIIFAGLMFSSEASLPASNIDISADSKFVNAAVAEESERFERSYPLNPNGRVSVSNVNGSITIDTWDRAEVKLVYVKTSDTKENLEDVQVIINARQDAFIVETEYESIKNRTSKSYKRLDVEYRLTVPRTAVLNGIETVNGSISIVNSESSTKASAVNGEVRATNLSGTANLSTVNGTIVADFDRLQTGSRISLNTVNGTVNLMIPSDANATIKADTVNGRITNDFGLPIRKGEYVGSDLYGKVGSGDVQIRLNSVNGGLSVKRKNDGKSVNPAINLLNQKNESNENWEDNEDGSRVRAPRPPKPPKPPKPPVVNNQEIDQSVKEALKEAEREIGKVKIELGEVYTEELNKQIKEAITKANSEQMQAQIRQAQELEKSARTRMTDVNWINDSPAIERKTETFSVKGTPKISIDAKNCAVSVRGWDKSEVSYSMVKMIRSNLKPSERTQTLSVKNSDSTVDIKVSMQTRTSGGVISDDGTKMRLEIFVPRKSNLKIISDGEIRLEGVSGEIDLQGSDQVINVRDSDGTLRAATSDGRIRVIGFRGAADIKTIDGAMNLEGDFQKLSAQTVDGTIVLTLPEDANVNIESNSKTVIGKGFALNLLNGGKNSSTWKIGSGGNNHKLFTTADGQVIVRCASDLNAIQ